eukprot:356160-Chlamydomonas_euryale.AAC.3
MDAGQDMSDDQQDIMRGQNMVDSLFQVRDGREATAPAPLDGVGAWAVPCASTCRPRDGATRPRADAALGRRGVHAAALCSTRAVLHARAGRMQGKRHVCLPP